MYMYACMCCLVARCACLHPFIAMRVHQCQRVFAAVVCQVAFDRLIAEFLWVPDEIKLLCKHQCYTCTRFFLQPFSLIYMYLLLLLYVFIFVIVTSYRLDLHLYAGWHMHLLVILYTYIQTWYRFVQHAVANRLRSVHINHCHDYMHE